MRSAITGVRAFAIGVALVLSLAGHTAAQDVAQVGISKSASQSTPAPGEDFTYYLSWSCTSLASPCVDASVTDALPTQVARTAADVGFSGNFADVDYTRATGVAVFTLFSPLCAGTTAQIGITVHFPAGTPGGTTAVNQATIDAANAAPAQSNQVTVTSVTARAAAC